MQLVAKLFVAEHLGQLAQYPQVQISRAFRHQQYENQTYRQSVRRVERNRFAHSYHNANRIAQTLDASVGNGHTLAESGGAEFFPRKQTVENLAARDILVILEQQSGVLENPLLAADVEIDHHILHWQQSGY